VALTQLHHLQVQANAYSSVFNELCANSFHKEQNGAKVIDSDWLNPQNAAFH
jgi:hypothetical protein